MAIMKNPSPPKLKLDDAKHACRGVPHTAIIHVNLLLTCSSSILQQCAGPKEKLLRSHIRIKFNTIRQSRDVQAAQRGHTTGISINLFGLIISRGGVCRRSPTWGVEKCGHQGH
jgi:hypothetical protein